jgi:hypothetical protein
MAASESNAQSTAFAIQGLVAAGRNPRKWRRTRTPLEFLKSLQAADGSVRYSRTSTQTPVWVTAQALNGLEAKPFPLPPAPRQKARSVRTADARASDARASGGEATAKAQPAKARPAKAHSASTDATPVRASTSTPLGTSEPEIETRPVAKTTTTTAPVTTSGDGEGDWWPFAFAALLGIVILVGLRLAWRRE